MNLYERVPVSVSIIVTMIVLCKFIIDNNLLIVTGRCHSIETIHPEFSSYGDNLGKNVYLFKTQKQIYSSKSVNIFVHDTVTHLVHHSATPYLADKFRHADFIHGNGRDKQ